MNKPLSALGLLGLLLVLILAPMGAIADTSEQATITTYTIPFWFEVHGNATVANGTTGNIILPMPYKVSPANAYLEYNITDANGTQLSDVSNIKLTVTINNETQLTTVLLSSGSPASATVPLSMSGVSTVDNVTVSVDNPLSSSIIAHVTLIVLDNAEFKVSVSPQTVKAVPGGTAQLTMTVTQTGGPEGTIHFTADNPCCVTTTFTPVQVTTYNGKSSSTTVTINVGKDARSGKYTITLKGDFSPGIHYNQPMAANTTYTFAEVALPIAVEAAGAGLAGFSLGALAGASIGYWAAAIGIIFLFVVLVMVLIARR